MLPRWKSAGVPSSSPLLLAAQDAGDVAASDPFQEYFRFVSKKNLYESKLSTVAKLFIARAFRGIGIEAEHASTLSPVSGNRTRAYKVIAAGVGRVFTHCTTPMNATTVLKARDSWAGWRQSEQPIMQAARLSLNSHRGASP